MAERIEISRKEEIEAGSLIDAVIAKTGKFIKRTEVFDDPERMVKVVFLFDNDIKGTEYEEPIVD